MHSWSHAAGPAVGHSGITENDGQQRPLFLRSPSFGLKAPPLFGGGVCYRVVQTCRGGLQADGLLLRSSQFTGRPVVGGAAGAGEPPRHVGAVPPMEAGVGVALVPVSGTKTQSQYKYSNTLTTN